MSYGTYCVACGKYEGDCECTDPIYTDTEPTRAQIQELRSRYLAAVGNRPTIERDYADLYEEVLALRELERAVRINRNAIPGAVYDGPITSIIDKLDAIKGGGEALQHPARRVSGEGNDPGAPPPDDDWRIDGETAAPEQECWQTRPRKGASDAE